MCIAAGPIGIAGLVLSAVSTLGAIQSQITQNAAIKARADAERNRAQYEAAVAHNNAQLANFLAEDAIEQGRVKEQQHRIEVRKLIAAQRTVYAANGVDVNIGTPVETAVDTAQIGEQDAIQIRRNAEREAYAHRTQAANFQTAEQFAQFRALQPDPPTVSPIFTAIGGLGELSAQYLKFRSSGILT